MKIKITKAKNSDAQSIRKLEQAVWKEEVVNKYDIPKESISALYGEPKNYPEYRDDYYAVFFEDPDKLKLEVMWFSK